jgi:hypothetical protein
MRRVAPTTLLAARLLAERLLAESPLASTTVRRSKLILTVRTSRRIRHTRSIDDCRAAHSARTTVDLTGLLR